MTGEHYLIDTELGDFSIWLDVKNAPETCGYFSQLFKQGEFEGSSIFRIVNAENAEMRTTTPIEVVQLGSPHMSAIADPKFAHEHSSVTGLRHKQWTISAARGEVGENYPSLFICMRDEPELDHGGGRHPDGQGFAAFGKVESGFETVQAIYAKAEDGEFLENPIAIASVVTC